MNDKFLLPLAEVSTEITIKNSRFISICTPAASVEEARAFIQRVKQDHPGANHHVPAFIIGHGASTITHSSDNGEPSGTAGKPTLAVLQGSGLGDVALVTVRYFGGIKLGTGGLVRAYTESAQVVLEQVQIGQKIATHQILVEIPYSLLELTRRLIQATDGILNEEAFSDQVLLTCTFPVEGLPAFQDGMRELSHGQIAPIIIETNPNSIFPL